jgi:hypothetical protein
VVSGIGSFRSMHRSGESIKQNTKTSSIIEEDPFMPGPGAVQSHNSP